MQYYRKSKFWKEAYMVYTGTSFLKVKPGGFNEIYNKFPIIKVLPYKK